MKTAWEKFLQTHRFTIGAPQSTCFCKEAGIRQDGTTPLCRDTDGTLWAMSGHTHLGHIGMFRGTCVADLREVYPVQTAFSAGSAETAYAGIPYPEGVKARGSIWPFGLYICPGTHRFFCFFHNETGWAGEGTAYDAYGPCEKPAHDFDFRHVGLMHSDDEGRTWFFDRWVLTAEEPCFTALYSPAGGRAKGQEPGAIRLGSGDFSLFTRDEDPYLYLFYNIIQGNTETGAWERCDVYVARARKRTDGLMSDFVKYYNGAFCEPGNLGKESPLAEAAWHPRVLWLEKYGIYLMSASHVPGGTENVVADLMELRVSADLLHWSAPVRVPYEGGFFGNHYVAPVPCGDSGGAFCAPGDRFAILSNHNGTDVLYYETEIGEGVL